ncbi:YrbL family protein [Marinibactrum halimedae]|uniref:PhoP regulatory network protein YrbL n=1 Tax=Marinibactrum halimedae TaxID=1444977 RepID=A0AA37T2Q9_9GAMM|nr:YrbL family protein [Marinibactrum halimedae]MCD9460468.1 PhoP regulatory network YrbL family protein [Marinibactrum halimedae]GLS25874.1 hypothetical protein GCM10007877_15880 [Marinibactrum halimedae]
MNSKINSSSSSDFVNLGSIENAFAQGGNRLCFVDPRNQHRCIKVCRPDRTPAIKRAKKSFPASLKPLHCFDDNIDEFRVYERINHSIGEAAYQLIPRCFGFINTNHGTGLTTEIIMDDDQLISLSLKQYIWVNGLTEHLQAIIQAFQHSWVELGMPSRNLLLHNLVVQQKQQQPHRIVVIDGIGWADPLPVAYWSRHIARKKSYRKAQRLNQAIQQLLETKAQNGEWGYHGWMEEQQRRLPEIETP